ncbi:hypothetical protein B0T16DRAFT_177851 [Cercophora newfieldiana]|uniref:Uncharacterized protein n=1 Tax=Cercophora newfieldiana TaxID=92897 RepID=A0AA40CMR6_9PEZI|nr:hypothetical protein B0T16DRAFT_177851 [Cercophora newfieldiana]
MCLCSWLWFRKGHERVGLQHRLRRHEEHKRTGRSSQFAEHALSRRRLQLPAARGCNLRPPLSTLRRPSLGVIGTLTRITVEIDGRLEVLDRMSKT